MVVYPNKTSLIKYIKEVFTYNYLVFLLSKKWIKTKYEDSFLGLGWMVLSPILSTVIYTVFFGLFINVGQKHSDYFLFIYSGMLPWIFFQDVFLEILDIFPKEHQVIKRTNFPRLILPLSVVLTKLIQLAFGIVLILILAFVTGKGVGTSLYLLPIVMIEISLFSMGIGLIIMIPSIIYRDLKHMIRYVVPLGLFSLPIFYGGSQIAERWKLAYNLNPLVIFIQSFRSVLFKDSVQWNHIIIGMALSILVFIAGVLIFRKYEKRIADFI